MFTHDFFINYKKNSGFSYTLIPYLDYFQPLYTDLVFLPERIVIKNEKNSILFLH